MLAPGGGRSSRPKVTTALSLPDWPESLSAPKKKARTDLEPAPCAHTDPYLVCLCAPPIRPSATLCARERRQTLHHRPSHLSVRLSQLAAALSCPATARAGRPPALLQELRRRACLRRGGRVLRGHGLCAPGRCCCTRSEEARVSPAPQRPAAQSPPPWRPSARAVCSLSSSLEKSAHKATSLVLRLPVRAPVDGGRRRRP